MSFTASRTRVHGASLLSRCVAALAAACVAACGHAVASAEEALRFEGTLLFRNYYPNTSNKAIIEPRAALSSRFTVSVSTQSGKWRFLNRWDTNVWTEAAFDGSLLYVLGVAPLMSRTNVTRIGGVGIVWNSSNGMPVGLGHCMDKAVWLALASGPALAQSNTTPLITPWDAPFEIIPESRAVAVQAECFGGVLRFPRTITYSFSEVLWKEHEKLAHRHPLPPSSMPFTNGSVVGRYETIEKALYAGAEFPKRFEITRLASHCAWTLERYEGEVTAVFADNVETFAPSFADFSPYVTIHDNRFADKEFPDLVVAYNITNSPLPSPATTWLQQSLERKKALIREERRRAMMKRG